MGDGSDRSFQDANQHRDTGENEENHNESLFVVLVVWSRFVKNVEV